MPEDRRKILVRNLKLVIFCLYTDRKEVFSMCKITPIPTGIEFYKEMISEGYYYIDKTLLIRDLLANKNKVTLFTRPRRFGKTLSQSMLRTFFEKEILPDGTVADNSVYFQGKRLWKQEKNIQGIWDSTR